MPVSVSTGWATTPDPRRVWPQRSPATAERHSCQKAGLTNAFLNNTLPFGSVNVTTLPLQLKAANVDTLYLPLDENTNFAIMTALKQAGLNLKVILNATGYGQALISDTSAVPDAQGAWFSPTGVPVELKTPATKAFQAALAKYAHYTGVPDFSWYEGWGGADLMIQGLEKAGKNPTQSGAIKGLQKLTAYELGGLESPVNLSLSHFGEAPSRLPVHRAVQGRCVRQFLEDLRHAAAELRPAAERLIRSPSPPPRWLPATSAWVTQDYPR